MYGYELAADLDRRSAGIFALGQGTLYPLLYSLETKGLIRVTTGRILRRSGPQTAVLRPDAKGRMELQENIVTWKEIARGMRLVLENSHA